MGSDRRREAESATAAMPGAVPGVSWRNRGLARRGQPGRTAGRWVAAARGGRGDGGGGAG
jgi:hypothetical protein